MSLSVFTVHVSCFPVSEYGDTFTVVGEDENDAVRAVSKQYKKNHFEDEGVADRLGRDDFDTLLGWKDHPYQNRSGGRNACFVEKVADLDVLLDRNDSAVLSQVLT